MAVRPTKAAVETSDQPEKPEQRSRLQTIKAAIEQDEKEFNEAAKEWRDHLRR